MTLIFDAFHAYLDPLLAKHSAGNSVLYDDLCTSWEATQAVVKKETESAVILKRVQNLHESQVLAYLGAAKKSLSEFAQNVELPSVEESETKQLYVERVLKSLTIPDWKVNTSVIDKFCKDSITKRASDAYQKFDEGEDEEENDEDENDDQDEGEEMVDDSGENEDDQDDDEGSKSAKGAPTNETQPTNKKAVTTKKRVQRGGKNAAAARKKKAPAKNPTPGSQQRGRGRKPNTRGRTGRTNK